MGWLDFLPDISLPENVDIDIINIGDDVEGDLIRATLLRAMLLRETKLTESMSSNLTEISYQ
jgi:hypothetical protein